MDSFKSNVVNEFDKIILSDNKIAFTGFSPAKNLNIASPSNRPFRVSVEGNIGAGKSTLINYFSPFPGIEIYPVSNILTF